MDVRLGLMGWWAVLTIEARYGEADNKTIVAGGIRWYYSLFGDLYG